MTTDQVARLDAMLIRFETDFCPTMRAVVQSPDLVRNVARVVAEMRALLSEPTPEPEVIEDAPLTQPQGKPLKTR